MNDASKGVVAWVTARRFVDHLMKYTGNDPRSVTDALTPATYMSVCVCRLSVDVSERRAVVSR